MKKNKASNNLSLPRPRNSQEWSEKEQDLLRTVVNCNPPGKKIPWKHISLYFFGFIRTAQACRLQWQTLSSTRKNSERWTDEEDTMILELRAKGTKYNEIAKHLPGRRGQGQHIKHRHYVLKYDRPWTEAENSVIFEQHKIFGNQWAKIESKLKNRSARAVRNQYLRMARRRELHNQHGIQSNNYSHVQSGPWTKTGRIFQNSTLMVHALPRSARTTGAK